MHEPSETLRLATPFGDHAVLQQGRPIPVWGWDRPGQEITARLASAGGRTLGEATGKAEANGRFRLELPPLGDGGPYELEVTGSSKRVSRDVWVGEVWLASGQSNMEWKVASAGDATQEIEDARWPAIRMFKVAPHATQSPAEDVAGAWAVCSPESVGDFSAVGYSFARALHEHRAVAIGVIDATWGGTCIEAWTSLEALGPLLPDLAQQRQKLAAELADLPAVEARYAALLTRWQREHLPADLENQGLSYGWASPEYDDADWPSLNVPGFWQAQGLNFNGVVWFRKTIELPAELAGHELELSLGTIDDFDDTYFDGQAIGRTGPGTLNAHQLRRSYRLSASSTRAGAHVIAVRVFDHFGSGGFGGPKTELCLRRIDGQGPRVPLAGAWRYRVEREIPLVPLSVFQTLPAPPLALAPQNAPASLFHGMVAPLTGYALRGIIWYQGESNTARHQSYRALQVALIRDYRTRFGQGQLPFYYVQLANYRASADWPHLREAQAAALSEPETGMVVTLDIGDPDDIHPKNKREVGRRLSLLARARTYGDSELEAEGPSLKRLEIQGREVRVEFAHARGLRTRDGQPPRGFSVAGPSGRYEPARARIVQEEVWLECDAVSDPRAVRYAWADHCDVNLENAAGLPAAPFRTDPY